MFFHVVNRKLIKKFLLTTVPLSWLGGACEGGPTVIMCAGR